MADSTSNSNMNRNNSNLDSKVCVICNRPFRWRKKWAKVWDSVKYCSDRCRRARQHTSSNAKMKNPSLKPAEIDRIIQMAWEDRTTFDAIKEQFDISPGDIIKLMRTELNPSSFRLWRRRTQGRKTKHLGRRCFVVGRFRCPS